MELRVEHLRTMCLQNEEDLRWQHWIDQGNEPF